MHCLADSRGTDCWNTVSEMPVLASSGGCPTGMRFIGF
jgi:hypothetical protein